MPGFAYVYAYPISIHAPHARSDEDLARRKMPVAEISIHAPHARSDEMSLDDRYKDVTFQSTLLMRGATQLIVFKRAPPTISIHAPHARSDSCSGSPLVHSCYFNPRSSCEERPACHICRDFATRISIHAPHARSDTPEYGFDAANRIFQSTLLMRGATNSNPIMQDIV